MSGQHCPAAGRDAWTKEKSFLCQQFIHYPAHSLVTIE